MSQAAFKSVKGVKIKLQWSYLQRLGLIPYRILIRKSPQCVRTDSMQTVVLARFATEWTTKQAITSRFVRPSVRPPVSPSVRLSVLQTVLQSRLRCGKIFWLTSSKKCVASITCIFSITCLTRFLKMLFSSNFFINIYQMRYKAFH